MAQLAGSGTINGAVTDASGAVVPGVDITIRNTDTGIERKTQTTDAGDYTAPFLSPGHYEVQSSKTGFAAVLRKDLVLQVGQTLTINLSLSVQAAQHEVTVTGEAPVVDTEKTENSQVVSEQAVGNLPVAGRRWDTFVLLTPNVTTDAPAGWFPTAASRAFTTATRSMAPTTTRRSSPKPAAVPSAALMSSVSIPSGNIR
jgi:hypothetical protein